jgi:hypothetical protein
MADLTANVRVVQRGQDFSFTLEPCAAIRVAGDRCGRDGRLEIAVGGAIDLTHTTAPIWAVIS